MEAMEKTEDVTKLRRALLALQRMQDKLAEMERKQNEPIAIIGVGCRFSNADSPETFWELLRSGTDAITEIPQERWNIDDYYDPDPDTPGKMYVRHGSFIPKIDEFDPLFFGISPREAELMDPQQRLLLEVSWEVLEQAGIVPQHLRGTATGVFVGMMSQDYAELAKEAGIIEPHSGPGNGYGMAAGRISHALGLQGPNVSIDTQCSSSLVALHLAVNSLRNQECSLALAGGVNLILTPTNTLRFCRTRAYAADGHCKTFDARADGMISSEGCGLVLLKRLSDAEADGDTILALIRGTAINHDGASSGFTVPNQHAQEALIRQALANAQLTPDQISYIEAHGTGTSLGDPIEVHALSAVFGQCSHPIYLGSVKTNLGHTDSAAGVAGLIKTVLALQNGEIPPHLNLQEPTPHVLWGRLPFHIPTELTPWPEPGDTITGSGVHHHGQPTTQNGSAQAHRRRAGISSFGMSGTNAHIVVEEWLPNQRDETQQPWADRAAPSIPHAQLLTLSAQSPAALTALVQRYAAWLPTQMNNAETDTMLATICHAANTTRTHFEHRLAVVAESAESLISKLTAFLQGDTTCVATGQAVANRQPKLAFLFTGQGAQYVHMGRTLYETEPLFRATLDRCEEILHAHMGESILAVIYPQDASAAEAASKIDQTEYTQPALFAIEYALAQLWRSWGVEPDTVLGHSVGEYVAACVAGIFSLEDALKLIAARGRLMQALAQNGAMVVIETDELSARKAIAESQNQVALAAINGPKNVVLSGEQEIIERIAGRLHGEGVRVTPLNVSHAFHSPLMEPMLEEFHQVAASITYHTPTKTLISNITGEVATTDIATPDYWVRHVREPVRFADSIERLDEQGIRCFLEIGPRATLLGMAQQIREQQTKEPAQPDGTASQQVTMLPSLAKNRPAREQILDSLGILYTKGVKIEWSKLYFDQEQKRSAATISLPTYPFQRQRYWLETTPQTRTAQQGQPAHVSPLIDLLLKLPSESTFLLEKELTIDCLPFLVDHQIFDVVTIPDAYYISTVFDAAHRIFPEQSVTISDIAFQQVFTIEVDQVYKMQAVFSLDEAADQMENLARFEIYGLVEGQHAGSPQLLASGRVIASANKQATERSPQTELLAQIRAECRNTVALDEVYQQSVEQNLRIGPSFQWLDAPQSHEKKAFAKLRRPDVVHDISTYSIHPGMLSSCFLVASQTVTDKTHDPAQGTLVTFGVESATLFAPIQGQEWWCFAEEVSTHSWNIQVFDAEERLVAEFKGYVKRPITAEHFHGGAAWHKWLYQVVWKPLPQSTPLPLTDAVTKSTTTAQESSWLMFGDKAGTGTALCELLRSRGDRVIFIERGSHFEQIDDQTYIVAPDQPSHFERILSTVSKPDGIIHLWSLDEVMPSADATFDPQAAVRASCISVLQLAQQSLHQYQNLPNLWLVTSDAQSVTAGDKVGGFAQSPLWGLGRSLMQENPELQCTCVDLTLSMTSDERARALLAELLSTAEAGDQPEDQVAWRHEQRYGLCLIPYDAQPRQTQDRDESSQRSSASSTTSAFGNPDSRHITVQKDKSYLITGGLTGLGLQVARYLGQQGAGQLILVGRSAPKPGSQPILDELASAGVKVVVAQADVAVAEQVNAVIAQIDPQMPLAGIVHAAGLIDDGILTNLTWERFESVFAPKVRGTWNLHNATRNCDLDFFVLFSSYASLLGSAGQANYAGANQFLDTFVGYRQQQGLPALSINWATWSGVGMAATTLDTLDLAGETAIEPAVGMEIFSTLLPSQSAQVTILPITDSQVFRQKFAHESSLLAKLPLITDSSTSSTTSQKRTKSSVGSQPEEAAPAALEETSIRERLQQANAAQAKKLILSIVHQAVLQVLKLGPTHHLDRQQGLFDMGLDSLLALTLRNRLQKELEVTLPPTFVFDHPTIEDMATYLAGSVVERSPETEPAARASNGAAAKDKEAETTPASEQTSDLGALGESALETLLLQKIASIKSKKQ